jgi:hypothetical protein
MLTLVGETLYRRERYDEAEPLFRRALAIREKSLGRITRMSPIA